MDLQPSLAGAPLEEPFTIHCVNNYTNFGLTGIADHLGLSSEVIGSVIRGAHRCVVDELRAAGVKYADLGPALVPKAGRYEVAYLFDSTQAEGQCYGYSYADKWIPVLKAHGPRTTAVSVGDIVELPGEIVWAVLEKNLVGRPGFPRLATNLYFVVYMTNLTASQLAKMHSALNASTNGYLGYVDCSTWNVLKLGLYLPQVALRLRDIIITAMDDERAVNLAGYPFEESGFRIVGVDEAHYDLLLDHRLDNGVPDWADTDSSTALTALLGNRQPAASSNVIVDTRRLQYLKERHGASLQRALLQPLSEADFAQAIEEKLNNRLVYNLRFIPGARGGMAAPELDALMYSMQLELRGAAGDVKRFQVGFKYSPDTHVSELTTFF
jgi:hypothetical protein